MFDKFQAMLHKVCATGFSPEILCFRTYFDILLTSISGERRVELDIDIHSLEAFRNIHKILKAICCSMSNDLALQNDVTRSALQIVVEKMAGYTDKEIQT